MSVLERLPELRQQLYTHLIYNNDAYTRDLITYPRSSENTNAGVRQPIEAIMLR